jgi:hypothetical protein
LLCYLQVTLLYITEDIDRTKHSLKIHDVEWGYFPDRTVTTSTLFV